MYTPKNKIITNQYTEGGTFLVKSTRQPYIGFYYKTSNGKFYSGKSPNNPPNLELETITELGIESQPKNKIAMSEAPTIFDDINTLGYDMNLIADYANLNNIDLNNPTSEFIPQQSYPTPTEDDYKLGVFTRYFCVKINEDKYIELSKEVYDKLVGKDSEYLWEPYTPFKLQWTIAGELDYVVNTNRNIILLTEKRLKRKGLDIFLRKNYNKFYST